MGYNIDFNALNVPDIGGAFTKGYESGRTKATLGALATNPNDANALNALMQVSPEKGMAFQDRQLKNTQAAQESSYKQAQIGKLQQEQAAARAEALASVAYAARNQPYQNRRAFIQQSMPQLQQIGFTPDQVAQFDPTDEAIDGIIAQAVPLKDQWAANKPTDVERELRAAGITPNDPQWKEAILNHVAPPQFTEFGSDATGRQLLQTRGMGSWGGGQGGGQPAPSAAPTGAAIEQLALNTVPGATVTSRARTPEHNREVGGIPNSYHVTDQARDLVPPRGMTMGQFYQTLKGSMPGYQVINEGDHVHIEPVRRGGGQRSAGGLPVVASTPPTPKPQAQRMSAAEVAAEGLPGGTYYRDTNGMPQKVEGQPTVNLRPVPAAAAKDYVENNSSLRKIHEALGAIDKNPGALGAQNYAPDFAMQRLDPNGVDVRAKVSDIGSLLIHDRSGAAVTISETPRLKPFVPSATDTPETARKKLRNLARALEDTQADIGSIYAEDQGYKGLPAVPKFDQAPPARIKGDADYNALPSGARFIGPDGHMRVKP